MFISLKDLQFLRLLSHLKKQRKKREKEREEERHPCRNVSKYVNVRQRYHMKLRGRQSTDWFQRN